MNGTPNPDAVSVPCRDGSNRRRRLTARCGPGWVSVMVPAGETAILDPHQAAHLARILLQHAARAGTAQPLHELPRAASPRRPG